jgi:hydroxyacylglutathione hydrolase
MARIPLEDNFTDVINKTQRGRKLTDRQLLTKAEISPAALAAVKAGKVDDSALREIARELYLSADALKVMAHQGWYPEVPTFPRGFMMFNTPFEDMRVNSYLVWDAKTKVAAAFDTGATAEPMLNEIQAAGLDLRYIFVTHTHDDHIADLPRLAKSTGAEVWASEREPVDFPHAKTFKENAHFHFGELAIKTLSTWGHSPGMTTFFVTGLSWPLAVVGDSIFASSMGGSPTHFIDQLENNQLKIMTLPRDTVLACGHGPLTTVSQEKKHNPFFAR